MKRTSVMEKLEACLARIADPGGEGARAFLTLYHEKARAEAAAADLRARAGLSLGLLDGAIVSIKDLYDVAGEPTRSGSRIFANDPPAKADAPAIARLRAAGAVIIGKTNMTEFAYSGIGMNPHYGTPGNPWERRRAPGGSSSGGAVSIADDMAEITIGSDTGGSTRIPAAFCGIVGFKPTQARIPRDGAFPLSPSLDSVGPMAKSVADCALADAAMAGDVPVPIEAAPLRALRIGIIQGMPLEGLAPEVGGDFALATTRLSSAGLALVDADMPLLAEMRAVIAKANFAGIEVHARLERDLAERGEAMDPIIRARLDMLRNFPVAEYLRMKARRAMLQAAYDRFIGDYDALALPSVAIVAPVMAELASPEKFLATNMMTLRNTAIANFFDVPSLSLPMHRPGAAPTGFMLFGKRMMDRRLFAIGAAIEAALAKR